MREATESGASFVEVLHGDARTLAARLDEHPTAARAQFGLIYMDPPYNVGKAHTARGARGLRRDGARAFEDAFETTAELVSLLIDALGPLVPRMADEGSLVVHMDARAVHDAKVGLDGLLGEGAYRGEIIWVPGNGARGKGVPRTHQTLLVYARSPRDRTRWDDAHPDLREPYAEGSLGTHFRREDASGRRYRERAIGGRVYRYYADEGRRLGSVWTDIPAMAANTPLAQETTGYPTQKPLRLLERLIRATTRPGDWVLDPMCGSGTTLVAARGLGRATIGNDAGQLAVTLTKARLSKRAGAPSASPDGS